MKATDFLKTRWGELAKTVEGEAKVRKEFDKWFKKTKNTTLAKRGKQLWDYFNSGNVSGVEKALIVAALLYLISPVDLIPDTIPFVGLLDDAGVATLVLDYVLKHMDDKRAGRETKDGKAKKGRHRSKVGPILKAVAKAMK